MEYLKQLDFLPHSVKKTLGIEDTTELWFGIIFFLCALEYVLDFFWLAPGWFDYIKTEIFLVTIVLAGIKIHTLGSIGEKFEQFDNENKKLKENNDKLDGILKNYQESNKQLAERKNQMDTEVEELRKKVDVLQTSISSLEDVSKAMEAFARENNVNMGDILHNLRDALTQQRSLLDQQQQVIDKTKAAVREQERVMLLQLQSQVQFMDQSSGMSKMEYEMFVNMLPQAFRESHAKLSKSFDELDINRDGTIDVAEFQSYVNQLIDIRAASS